MVFFFQQEKKRKNTRGFGSSNAEEKERSAEQGTAGSLPAFAFNLFLFRQRATMTRMKRKNTMTKVTEINMVTRELLCSQPSQSPPEKKMWRFVRASCGNASLRIKQTQIWQLQRYVSYFRPLYFSAVSPVSFDYQLKVHEVRSSLREGFLVSGICNWHETWF